MKKFKIVSSFVALTMLFLTSCGDTEPLDPAIDLGNHHQTTGSFTVNINGVIKTTDNVVGIKSVQTVPGSTTTITSYILNATFSDGKGVVVQFTGNGNSFALGAPAATDFGQVSYTPNMSNPSVAYASFNTNNVDEVTGHINVTNNDETELEISGVFDAKTYKSVVGATESVQLTNGVFENIHYTIQ